MKVNTESDDHLMSRTALWTCDLQLRPHMLIAHARRGLIKMYRKWFMIDGYWTSRAFLRHFMSVSKWKWPVHFCSKCSPSMSYCKRRDRVKKFNWSAQISSPQEIAKWLRLVWIIKAITEKSFTENSYSWWRADKMFSSEMTMGPNAAFMQISVNIYSIAHVCRTNQWFDVCQWFHPFVLGTLNSNFWLVRHFHCSRNQHSNRQIAWCEFVRQILFSANCRNSAHGANASTLNDPATNAECEATHTDKTKIEWINCAGDEFIGIRLMPRRLSVRVSDHVVYDDTLLIYITSNGEN